MAGSHEVPLDCTHCAEGQVLIQRVSTLEAVFTKHLERFDTHMEREEKAFNKIYDKLEQISRDLGNVQKEGMRERQTCKTEIEQDVEYELEKIETKLNGFVTKAEARMIWVVVTTVILGAAWFFSNVQLSDSNVKQNALIELNRTQTAILKELKGLNQRGKP